MASIETREHRTGTSFRVIWWEPGRKRRAVTFADADKAARFLQLVEGSGNRLPAGWTPATKAAPVPKIGKLTFGVWAARAIDNRSRANERTKDDYRRSLDRHFADLLPLALDEIGDDQVTAWTADRETAKLAVKTIRNLHGFASSLYVDALRQHPPLVEYNPFADRLGQRGNVHTEDMVFLTPQEFATVLGYVKPEYQGLIRLLAGTGLRFGEATALHVRDVELLAKRKTLTVTKAWKRTAAAGYVLGEPKTKRSRRTISLSPELVDLMAEVTAGKRGDELIFAGPQNLRLPHIEVYKRGWAPAVARANVCDACYEPQRDGRHQRPRLPDPCTHLGVIEKRPRIHDLRHSHAAWLISDGIILAAISRRLGHSSITITVDRYGHLDPSLDDQIDLAVDRALATRRDQSAEIDRSGRDESPILR